MCKDFRHSAGQGGFAVIPVDARLPPLYRCFDPFGPHAPVVHRSLLRTAITALWLGHRYARLDGVTSCRFFT